MGNPWYRAWVGLVSDQKIAEAAVIADSPRCLVIAIWHALLESASEADDGGTFVATPRRIAAVLLEKPAQVEAVFAAFIELEMIRDGRVVAWLKRQKVSESAANTAERQAKSRAGRRGSGCHNLSQPVTPPEEEEEEETDYPPPPPPPASANACAEDRSVDRPFAELTGAEIVTFPTTNPLEAEARAFAAGLPLAGDLDFEPIAALVASGGASRGDVLAVIEEARAKREKCPKSWARLAPWAAGKARERATAAARSGARPATARAPDAGDWRAHFEAVWAGFPRDRTASRPRAEAAFAQLSPGEQRAFAAAIGAVAAHIRGLKLTQPYDLARFIAERRFEGFSAAAASSAPAKVRVARDSPAGEAWERHWRATRGTGAPWPMGDGFWFFDSEFPPAPTVRFDCGEAKMRA